MSTALRIAAASLAAGLMAACQTAPPPPPPPPPPPADTDGTPAEALPRTPGDVHVDQIDRNAGDLDDWHRFEIPGEGTFEIRLVGPDGAALPYLVVAITDERGVAPGPPTRTGGRPAITLQEKVGPGPRLVWVGSESEASGPVAYELEARFTPRPPPPRPRRPRPPPPPPAPAFDVFETRVVEISQGRGDAQFATISGGVAAGMRPGLRGRLKQDGRVIGTFEVVEVYPAGSRIRIEGRLSAPVTGQTAVEVDVPR